MAQFTFSYMHAYNNNYNICYFTSIKCQLIIIIIITAKWRCSDSATYNLFTNEMPHSWIKGSCLGRGTRQQKWLIPGRNTDEKSVQLLTQPMKSDNFNTDDVSLTGWDFVLTNADLPTDASSVWSLGSFLRSHFAGWQAKWYVVAKCLPFSHSTAIPDYTFCVVVLDHNFDLNFDVTQTAEECNFF